LNKQEQENKSKGWGLGLGLKFNPTNQPTNQPPREFNGESWRWIMKLDFSVSL